MHRCRCAAAALISFGASVFAQFGVVDPNGEYSALLSLTSGLQAMVGI